MECRIPDRSPGSRTKLVGPLRPGISLPSQECGKTSPDGTKEGENRQFSNFYFRTAKVNVLPGIT